MMNEECGMMNGEDDAQARSHDDLSFIILFPGR